MKQISKIIIALLMITCMCGCAGPLSFGPKEQAFSEDDLVFVGEDSTIQLDLNQSIYIGTDYAYTEEHSAYSYTDYYENFQTARGLECGDYIDDYKDAYFKRDINAVWEICYDDYTTMFKQYDGKSIDELSDSSVLVWLDCGYYRDGDKWKRLSDYEVKDIWFCDAEFEDYDEVVIISANLSEDNQISCISFNYFEYDEDFAAYLSWEE